MVPYLGVSLREDVFNGDGEMLVKGRHLWDFYFTAHVLEAGGGQDQGVDGRLQLLQPHELGLFISRIHGVSFVVSDQLEG